MTSVMNGMCRCCATEGVYKDIKTSYTWMGEEEVYADMLRECFDLCLSTSEGVEDGGICEVCITQLRNAANFKKQVQNTEEQFKKLALNKLFKPNIVKVEADEEDAGNDSDDNNASADESYSGPEYEVPIKTETEDPKPRKRAVTPRAAKASTSRAKKSKADNGEPSTKRVRTIKITIGNISTSEEKGDVELLTNIKKNRNNIKEVLRYSNATPIRTVGDLGYVCSYCHDKFKKAAELKKHTLDTHKDIDKAFFMKTDMARFVVRLDITLLKCNICNQTIDTLEELMGHLKSTHNKTIYTDIKNHIIPLKFTTDELKCCICNKTFSKYKKLLEHMNSHYMNYICDVCETGFVTRMNYNQHQLTHKTGTFECNNCSQVFDTLVKMKSHERAMHSLKPPKLHKCGICHESFTDYRKKETHLFVKHGKNIPKAQCSACEKICSSKNALAAHIRRDHLLERRFRCSICDKSFFTMHCLKRHSVKHTGLRSFKCTVCPKAFGRPFTLREHMKIHNNVRDFKCDHCGQSFVQKCSWKGHMKNKHGENI